MGLTKFYTGQHCPNGHDSPRYETNGMCVECRLVKHHASSYRRSPTPMEYDDIHRKARDLASFGRKPANSYCDTSR